MLVNTISSVFSGNLPQSTYDRQTLLDICNKIRNLELHFSMNGSVLPWLSVQKQCQRKRGKWAGILVRLRNRQHLPLLPSILLQWKWVLLSNSHWDSSHLISLGLVFKLDELQARMAFHWDIKSCSIYVFTITRLDPSVPDLAIVSEGLSIHFRDRTKESGMCKGSDVCIMTSKQW